MDEQMPRAGGSIVVGVDDESPSSHALEWALRRAARTGAAVSAVWVVADAEDDDDAADALAACLDTARQAVGDEVPVTLELLRGDVVGALGERAAAADLLVIGTNFSPTLFGRLRGTRSLSIAAEAPVPVVVVPEVELAGRAGVVVGVDGSESDLPAVPWAAAEAEAQGEDLVLLRAAVIPVGAVPAYVQVGDFQEAVIEDAREQVNAVAARLRESYPDLVIHGRVTSERPVVALSEAAESAALVVVGSRGMGTLRRFLQGSVSAEVMLTMTGPVAVIR